MVKIIDGEFVKTMKGHPDFENTYEVLELRGKAIQKFREKLKTIQENVINEMDKKVEQMLHDLLKDIQQFGDIKNGELKNVLSKQKNGTVANGSHENKDSTTPTQRNNGKLSEKIFVPRNSLLTDLLEVQHIRTIYHIFIVILLILFLHTLVYDYVANGSINIGLKCIKTGFAKFDVAIFIWSILQTLTFCLYYVFKFWAMVRHALSSYPTATMSWDAVNLSAFISFQIGFLVFSFKQVYKTNVGEACAMALLMETVRLMMKHHAFVRSNTPKILSGNLKDHDTDSPVRLPSFGTYAYYLFCPTLVYRDNYPRTSYTRWNKVLWHYVEVIGTVFYISFIFERFLIPYYKDFGRIPMEPKTLVLALFGCILPGTMSMLCAFFCLLHSWMNASAEILRFADRTFYKDWWNAPSFSVYYRTWNIVVHDWLYTYIYKDLYENVFRGSKTISALTTFTISAIFHEILLTGTLKFFYPVMFVMFLGVGCSLFFLNVKKHNNFGNIFFWLSLSCGSGLMLSLYTIEYFARMNCSVEDNTWWNIVIPMSWRCY